jgi:F-type H+-transporting ATPase subunit b
MPSLALAQGASHELLRLAAEGGEGGGLTINVFWIVVAATNFIVFFYIAYKLVLVPVGERLADRRERIEQGLKDADAARRDREAAADQRAAVLAEARREASDIVARAQKMADEQRQKGVAETQSEIERLRASALADIDAERLRALADVRGQVADLALLAAGKVVGETMGGERERRLVDEFLTQVSASAPTGGERN